VVSVSGEEGVEDNGDAGTCTGSGADASSSAGPGDAAFSDSEEEGVEDVGDGGEGDGGKRGSRGGDGGEGGVKRRGGES
jgi:hypothetical protein